MKRIYILTALSFDNEVKIIFLLFFHPLSIKHFIKQGLLLLEIINNEHTT